MSKEKATNREQTTLLCPKKKKANEMQSQEPIKNYKKAITFNFAFSRNESIHGIPAKRKA